MKLLTEICDAQVLTEEKDGKKNYFIEGVFLQSELKNRNGRWYPKSILEREVARYVKDYINENRAVGELGHPDTPTVNYDRSSHKILSLRENGNNYVGRAKIMDTPMGKIVKTLLDEGVKIGVSSRGMGSLKPVHEGTVQMVQDDYYLATAADIVADPSAPDALVQGILEHREWVWDNGLIKEVDVANIYAEIQAAKRKNIEATVMKNFEKFMGSLSSGS
jgi:Prohead core protein serine protease